MSIEQDKNDRGRANDRRTEATDLYAKTREYLQQPVRIETNDGQTYQGIIENVDDHYVYLAMAQDDSSDGFRSSEHRQFFGYGYPPYNAPWYGGYYGGYPGYYPYGYYGYPGGINRLILPLAALTAISLLPYY